MSVHYGTQKGGSLGAMHWFALTVKPRHEVAAAAHLLAKSLEAYAPVRRQRRRWSDRVKLIEAPLFPRYIFCRFQFEDRLKVLGTSGVNSIVSFDGAPCPVSDQEIETIRRIASASDISIEPWPYVQIGQRVRICEGLLSGVEGILVKVKGTCRVVVTVEAMQRAVALEIDLNSLEPTVERKAMSNADGSAGRLFTSRSA
jgi:transcription elongation factor/antiterminator RfaH